MRKYWPLWPVGLLLLLSVSVFFKKPDDGDILALKYANELRTADLEDIVNVLAADSLEGRLVGTPGERKAADFIASRYAHYYIEPFYDDGYFQSFDIVQTNVPDIYLATDRNVYELGVDFLTFFPHDSIDFMRDHIIYVGYGIEDPRWNDYAYHDVKGQIVLVKAGEPRDQYGVWMMTGLPRPSEWAADPIHSYILKREAAKRNGAIGMLYYDPKHFSQFKAIYDRISKSSTNTTDIQVDSLYDFIIGNKILDDIGYDNLDDVYYTGRRDRKWTVPFTITYNAREKILSSQNVIAWIRGKERPGECVLVLANYDGMGKFDTIYFPGANNNATGTAALIEMARLFQIADADGYTPKRSILFVHTSGREKNHLGAKYYIKHPPIPLFKTKAVVDVDMIGYVDTLSADPNNIYVTQELGRKKFMDYLKAANKAGPQLKIKTIKPISRFVSPETSSDVIVFRKKKLPYISFVNGTYPYIRTPEDTPDKITWDVYTERTKFIFMSIWKLANE